MNKRRLGAVSAAMIEKAIPRECVHGVIMASRCTLCFKEFRDKDTRRFRTHVEQDWDPLLKQLDPNDGPLTSMLYRFSPGGIISKDEIAQHIDMHLKLAAIIRRDESIGGTSND